MGLKVGYIRPMIFSPKDESVFIQGYPACYYGKEKEQHINSNCQYKISSKDILIEGNCLYHSMSTTAGQSGSPILMRSPEKDDIYPVFIGMHISGAEYVNLEDKNIKKYPYHGLYVTEHFLKNLKSLFAFLESVENNSQKRKKSFFIKKNVCFYLLKDKKNTRLYNHISTDSSSTSSDDLLDMKTFLKQGKIFFEKGNYQKAKILFKEAEKMNLFGASSELAKTYSKLAEKTIFEENAFKYYLKAAQRGKQAQDQFQVAEQYYKGSGVQKNCKEALIWYRKAADQNHAKAQFLLGNCYYYGYGTKVNMTEANRFYNLAQRNGYDEYDSFYYCSII